MIELDPNWIESFKVTMPVKFKMNGKEYTATVVGHVDCIELSNRNQSVKEERK
ncbi:hypothetical protein GOV13_02645 [Candidatus Pacearchaeota archaeon]|nr:hypothetical protein [Candidatus Pacearchaeota archaeon]